MVVCGFLINDDIREELKLRIVNLIYFPILLWCTLAVASPVQESRESPWNISALSVAPRFTEDLQRSTTDIKAIYFDSVPWQGRPTKVFAYYGVPKTTRNEKVPAMVLIHGGKGTAHSRWVRLWVSRGYAAIAIDTNGSDPGAGDLAPKRYKYGGPPGWKESFSQVSQPIEDQWPYHAVANIILAHSLIRSFAKVDPDRIGITGISWGGYLTAITAGVDHRFKFAAPVYGCGFLGDNSKWLEYFDRMGPTNAHKWLSLWDPADYLSKVQIPMLWVDGTNDVFYPMDSLQKSYRLSPYPRTLSMRVRMPHSHLVGENVAEIYAMAENLFGQGAPLSRISKAERHGKEVSAKIQSEVLIEKGELNYTTDVGEWKTRRWKTIPAILSNNNKIVSAQLPEDATVYYFNIVDARGLYISTEHEELIKKSTNEK